MPSYLPEISPRNNGVTSVNIDPVQSLNRKPSLVLVEPDNLYTHDYNLKPKKTPVYISVPQVLSSARGSDSMDYSSPRLTEREKRDTNFMMNLFV